VAPNLAGVDKPDLSKVFAIRVRRAEGVIFAPGAWHWVPYPIKKGKSFALVGFAIDTPANDMSLHPLSPGLRMRL
jgi:ureidoglycolate hydrolase